MKRFLAAVLISISVCGTVVNAQVIKDVREDVTHFFDTGGDMFNSFTSFEKPTQIKLAASLAVIAGSYALDNNIKDFAVHNHSNVSDKIFSIDKIYGSGYTLVGIAGIYGYGVIFKNDDVRRIGLQTIEAVGYTGIITSVLKTIVGRSRPYTNESHSMFRPFNFHAATTSFPSGHSTVAFAMSTVLANNTDNVFLKILYYTAAGMVGYSRLYHNDHWFSDVVAGSAIGYFVGDFVSRDSAKNQKADSNFSFSYSAGLIGISINF